MKKTVLFILASIILGLLMCFASFAADSVVYVADGGIGDGSSATTPVGTLDAAYAALGDNGGTVVVVGMLPLANILLSLRMAV